MIGDSLDACVTLMSVIGSAVWFPDLDSFVYRSAEDETMGFGQKFDDIHGVCVAAEKLKNSLCGLVLQFVSALCRKMVMPEKLLHVSHSRTRYVEYW
jgi:hypothetical protein